MPLNSIRIIKSHLPNNLVSLCFSVFANLMIRRRINGINRYFEFNIHNIRKINKSKKNCSNEFFFNNIHNARLVKSSGKYN